MGLGAVQLTQVGIALYAVLSIIYFEFGRFNNDEAWYLYAGKMVLQGAFPYQNFAFPQMPLLPYIYALSQAVVPAIWSGRIISIILSFGTLGMSVVVARRYGGELASGITAMLLACFTFGIYFNTIVKSYALVTFLFVATLFLLSSDLEDIYKYPLAVVFAALAVLVRVTALFFVLPVALYVLLLASRRAKIYAMAAGAFIALIGALWLVRDWPAARWGLFSSHLTHWEDNPATNPLWDILTLRFRDIAQAFGPLLVLAAGTFYSLAANRPRNWLRRQSPLGVFGIGLALFALSHLANGQWETEYLVPAVTALIPLLGIGLAHLFGRLQGESRRFAQGALVALLVLIPMAEGTQHLDIPGGQFPLQQVDAAAAFVEQHSQPGDRVLALEAMGVVMEAHRTPMADMTLAQFSFQDLDTATAQQLHVVNFDLTVQALNSRQARVVVLSDFDWDFLNQADTNNTGALHDALDRNYAEALNIEDFGQFSRRLHIYLLRE